MTEKNKFFAVTVDLDKESAWLAEFELGKLATDDVDLIGNENLFPEEFPEYIADSENWISLELFVEGYGLGQHWSGIGRARMISKIRNALICGIDELVYIYKNGEFEGYGYET